MVLTPGTAGKATDCGRPDQQFSLDNKPLAEREISARLCASHGRRCTPNVATRFDVQTVGDARRMPRYGAVNRVPTQHKLVGSRIGSRDGRAMKGDGHQIR